MGVTNLAVRGVAVIVAFVLLTSTGLSRVAAQTSDCQFEPVSYGNEGLTITGAVFYVPSTRYPLLVHNHGQDRQYERLPAWEYSIGRALACRFVREYKVAFFFAERCGYGGSDGPTFSEYVYNTTALRSSERGQKAVARFRQEATDVEAGVEFIRNKPYINAERITIMGISAGGVLSIFLGARPIRGLKGVISIGPGLLWGTNRGE